MGNAPVAGAAGVADPRGTGLGTAATGVPVVVPTAGVSGAGGVAGAVQAGAPAGGVAPQPVLDPSGQLGSWRSFGGDLAHSRASPDEQRVSAANVAELNVAWLIDAPGVTATPAVEAGIVYWADWGGIVHATRIFDQMELWRVDYADSGGGYTGSPALSDTSVFVANRNGLLTALDRATGAEQWRAVLDAGPHTHIWSSPIAVEQDGVVIIGVGGVGTRDNGRALPRSQIETFKGWVEGFDMQTGESLWKLQTTADWGAGVSVWSSASVDTERKLAFIGTGNNYYRPVSPYSDSLLAINYLTGELVWHAQFTENDAWTVGTTIGGGVDGDVGATPNLFMIGDRAVVGVGDKPGDYHVLDRDTGAPVWSHSLTRGGFQGGVMAPAAYDDGVIYVISNNGYTDSTVFALDASDGGELWTHDLPATTFGPPALGNGVLYVGDQAGNVQALDIRTGSELWSTRLPGVRGGGFALVDGMLFSGYGFHFSESRQEPLAGGLVAYSLAGELMPVPVPTDTTDCEPDYVATAEPTFTNVYQGVICSTGCGACHGPTEQGTLGLHPKDEAYRSLVGVTAGGMPCAGSEQMLVQAGDPDASLMYLKLDALASCGDAMPPGDPNNSPVTPEMRALVRAWIAAGAPND